MSRSRRMESGADLKSAASAAFAKAMFNEDTPCHQGPGAAWNDDRVHVAQVYVHDSSTVHASISASPSYEKAAARNCVLDPR